MILSSFISVLGCCSRARLLSCINKYPSLDEAVSVELHSMRCHDNSHISYQVLHLHYSAVRRQNPTVLHHWPRTQLALRRKLTFPPQGSGDSMCESIAPQAHCVPPLQGSCGHTFLNWDSSSAFTMPASTIIQHSRPRNSISTDRGLRWLTV